MGACYNTILVPAIDRETLFAAIGDALHPLGYRIVHREEPASYADGFHYRSAQMIFGGPSEGSVWIPLSSWGDGIPCKFPEWYRRNPLAQALSWRVSPVIYLFTYDAGCVAGYSIFKSGQQVEAVSLTPKLEWALGEFAPAVTPPERPSMLSETLGEPDFDYENFMRGFRCLEVATAALSARLGAKVHLIDPLNVQDGDGALVVESGEYKRVSLPGWFGLYYEKAAANLFMANKSENPPRTGTENLRQRNDSSEA